MASASESEIGASFINAQDAVPELTTLIEMGQTKPSTRTQLENTTANEFSNKTPNQKRSKAIEMCFYWIQDRCSQRKYIFLEIRSNQYW